VLGAVLVCQLEEVLFGYRGALLGWRGWDEGEQGNEGEGESCEQGFVALFLV
jgi:hypothetical protein